MDFRTESVIIDPRISYSEEEISDFFMTTDSECALTIYTKCSADGRVKHRNPGRMLPGGFIGSFAMTEINSWRNRIAVDCYDFTGERSFHCKHYETREEAVLAYNEFVRKFTSPDAYEIIGDGELILTDGLIECIYQTRGHHDKTTGTYVPSPELKEYISEKRDMYKFMRCEKEYLDEE